jgi:predicted nucleic acid-binding protein
VILLIDTDVLIDFATDRQPHSKPAGRLLDYLERRPGTAFVAWHTVSNFYYLVSSQQDDRASRAFLQALSEFIEVAPISSQSLETALSLPMGDFEDAMQVAAALECGAEAIVTRNLRDYRDSPIRALTPGEVLSLLPES